MMDTNELRQKTISGAWGGRVHDADDEIDRLRAELADTKADRDSWEQQAADRVKDCSRLIDQLAAANARADANEQDAARYRWLTPNDVYRIYIQREAK